MTSIHNSIPLAMLLAFIPGTCWAQPFPAQPQSLQRPESIRQLFDPEKFIVDLSKLEEEQQKLVAALPQPVRARLEKARESVGVVRGPAGLGSGFIVAPGVMATNSHVLRSDLIKDIYVQFISDQDPNPKKHSVRLLFEDMTQDLALLEIDSDRTPLTIATAEQIKSKLPIAVIGNPAQINRVASVNRVTVGEFIETRADISKSASFYRIKAFAEKGNSGGPVLNQQNGDVIGVLTRGKSLIDNECVPSPTIKTAVDSIGPKEKWDALSDRMEAYHAAVLAYEDLQKIRNTGELMLEVWTKMVESRYGEVILTFEERKGERKNISGKEVIDLATKQIQNSYQSADSYILVMRQLKASTDLRESMSNLKMSAQILKEKLSKPKSVLQFKAYSKNLKQNMDDFDKKAAIVEKKLSVTLHIP